MRQDMSRLPIIFATAMLTVAGIMGASAVEQEPKSQPQPGTAGNRPTVVDLDDLEDNPEKFIGKTVTVEGEVERVLGPHLFTIDEKDWVDPEREMPVVVAEPFAAIVRSDAPVRVTGTVQKVPIAQIKRDWEFLSNDPKIKAEIETRPVLVATEVTTTTPAAVSLRMRTDQPVGTSGTGAAAPLTDVGQVARATDKNLVGRRVDLNEVTVTSAGDQGFWIRLPAGERVFVM